MTILLGLMCIFSACSTAPSAPASPTPNLVVTVAPGHADIGVDGIKVDTLSQTNTSYNSNEAMTTSFLAEPGAYYTVEIEAEGRSPFTKKYFLRDGRKINLKVGLATKADVSDGKYTASFEAEAADVKSVFDVKDDDESASSGSYLVQPASVSGTSTPPEEASLAFNVEADDTYTLWARMYAPSGSNDALYLGFDEQLERTTTKDYKKYAWVKAYNKPLSAGDHRVSIGHAEAGARLDLLVVTNQELSAADLDKFVTTVEFEETQVGATSEASTSSGTVDTRKYALRGNPDFTANSLTPEQRTWYDRLWAAIENPEQYPNATKLAQTDDTYEYRGSLQDHSNALLTAFRMTGDLRLLDEVSRLSELMRQELKDEWRDSLTGDNGKKDGYLNWVTRYNPKSNKQFIGNDTQMAYDLKANAHVALFAWAFENNRDLKSPGGYDYAKQADFWEDYLVNHFEAKWRSRNGKATGFPFAEHTGLHTYHSFMKWHHYMGKLTGKSAYTQEAERMADILWQNEFKEVSTQYGTGLVWPRGVLSLGSRENYLHPQGYARYVVQEAIDLHFEGFNRYAQSSMLEKMANMVADFVVTSDKFSPLPKTIGGRDIGGGRSRAGIPASSSSWDKMTPYRFAESSWSYLTAWDENSNNKIEKTSEEIYEVVSLLVYDRDPRRVFIPVGMLIDETLN